MNRGSWNKIVITKYQHDPNKRHKKHRGRKITVLYQKLDTNIRNLLLSLGKKTEEIIYEQISICHKNRNGKLYLKILLEGKLYVDNNDNGRKYYNCPSCYFVIDLYNNLIKELFYNRMIDFIYHDTDEKKTNVIPLSDKQLSEIKKIVHDYIISIF